jgi:hypothetical protein
VKEKVGNVYTLHLRKIVATTARPFDSPASCRLQKRAINALREYIWRQLERKPNAQRRTELRSELRMLFHIETCLGVKHSPIAIYEMETGRRIHRNTWKYQRTDRGENLCANDSTAITPQLIDGRKRAPNFLLPLDDNGIPYVPTADELFDRYVLLKFYDNFPIALARLEKINPKRYAGQVKAAAEADSKIKRARARVHSDVRGAKRFGLSSDERFALENFYETTRLDRPLCLLSRERAVFQLAEFTDIRSAPAYGRILKKFGLSSFE